MRKNREQTCTAAYHARTRTGGKNRAPLTRQKNLPICRGCGILAERGREERETLNHISRTLDAVLAFLKKPKNRFQRITELTATVVTILGIIGFIDIIKAWLGG